MSFSAIMDTMGQSQSDLDVPTRPVTPENNNNNLTVPSASPNPESNGRRLYHSESVTKALNQLSKDLSGSWANTLFSSKADKIPPPLGIGSSSDLSFGFGFKPQGAQSAPDEFLSHHVGAPSSAEAPVLTVSPADCTLSRPNNKNTVLGTDETRETPVEDLLHFYNVTHNTQMIVEHVVNNNGIPRDALGPPNDSANRRRGVKTDYLPPLYPAQSNTASSVPASQESGSSGSSKPSISGSKILSPTPSTPALSYDSVPSENGKSDYEEEEDDDEDDYNPLKRNNTARPRRSTGSSAGRSTPSTTTTKVPKTKSNHPSGRPKAKLDDQTYYPRKATNHFPIPLPISASMPSSLATNSHQQGAYSVPSAPDAEANSDYENSDAEEDAATMTEPKTKQSNRSVRGRAPGRPSARSKRGVDAGSGGAEARGGKTISIASTPAAIAHHPYKNPKLMAPPGASTGRQTCSYVSPYDDWKCDQELARSYDVPRHMEVHAKEEYELVLTGKLAPHLSELFDCVSEANVYICLVCRKDFSRKDAMQRHIRNSSKMSKAKHRAENSKMSIKKRLLGTPKIPHPGIVSDEILQRHRRILNKLRDEAIALGQDVTEWDVENMLPRVSEVGEGEGAAVVMGGAEGSRVVYSGTDAVNAPGIPVGRRTGNRKGAAAASEKEKAERIQKGGESDIVEGGPRTRASRAAVEEAAKSNAGGKGKGKEVDELLDEEDVDELLSTPNRARGLQQQQQRLNADRTVFETSLINLESHLHPGGAATSATAASSPAPSSIVPPPTIGSQPVSAYSSPRSTSGDLTVGEHEEYDGSEWSEPATATAGATKAKTITTVAASNGSSAPAQDRGNGRRSYEEEDPMELD